MENGQSSRILISTTTKRIQSTVKTDETRNGRSQSFHLCTKKKIRKKDLHTLKQYFNGYTLTTSVNFIVDFSHKNKTVQVKVAELY